MSSDVHIFNSQVKAQAYVKSLMKKGLEPGADFSTKTLSNGSYEVCVYKKLGIFGA